MRRSIQLSEHQVKLLRRRQLGTQTADANLQERNAIDIDGFVDNNYRSHNFILFFLMFSIWKNHDMAFLYYIQYQPSVGVNQPLRLMALRLINSGLGLL